MTLQKTIDEIQELRRRASPGNWETKNNPGAGIEISADVRAVMGDKFADLTMIFGFDSCPAPRFLISYERWVQFPTFEWREMQKANAQLIVATHNAFPDLVKKIEELTNENNHLRTQLREEK